MVASNLIHPNALVAMLFLVDVMAIPSLILLISTWKVLLEASAI